MQALNFQFRRTLCFAIEIGLAHQHRHRIFGDRQPVPLVRLSRQDNFDIAVGIDFQAAVGIQSTHRAHIAILFFITPGNGDKAEVGDRAARTGDSVIVGTVDLGSLVIIVRVISPDLGGLVRRTIKAREIAVSAFHKHVQGDACQSGEITPTFCAM